MRAWHIRPAKALTGRWTPSGDKSITHRAILLGALAEGQTEIDRFLESDDCFRTLQIVQALGAHAERLSEQRWRLTGLGTREPNEPNDVLDAGNSGTTTRLMAGVLASAPIFSVLTGDESLRRRPMRRIVEPLRQ
ncbi:MAG: 3-phosphoshikimate 1-carboxyvinyltransferase, partial [Fimbriimonadales bacterium]